jgi:hypothetical protein
MADDHELDSLATMIEEERETYQRWLNAPEELLALIHKHVRPQIVHQRWGKLIVVGTPNVVD